MKKIISVLLCVLILAGTVFVVNGVTGTEYSSASKLLSGEYGITSAQLVYNNSLDDTDTPPLTEFYNSWYSQGTSVIKNGQWHINMAGGKALAFKDGLLPQKIGGFAYSFEFQPNGGWTQAYFTFHENGNTPDWNTANGSYILMKHNSNASATYPTLVIDGQVNEKIDFLLTNKKVYNVLLIVCDGKYDLYVWEKGKSVKNPIISVQTNKNNSGNFTYNNYQASHYIDNIKIYDLSLLGENISGANLLYDNDFNRSDATVPMGIGAAVSDNALKVSGSNITSTSALTGLNSLTDFQFMADYSTALSENCDENWQFADGEFSLKIESGKVSIVADTTKSKDFAFVVGKVYQIAVRYKDEKAAVYIWEKGTTAPQKPLVENNVGKVSGDITYNAAAVDSVYDNIKVYDLSMVAGDNSLKKLAEWNFEDPSAKIPIKGAGSYAYDNGTLSLDAVSTDGFFGSAVSDFFWQFDYIPAKVQNNTDSFIFHKNTVNGSALALAILGNGNIEIRSIMGSTVNTLASTTVEPFVSKQLYTVRIMFIDDTVYVKMWKKDAGTPTGYTLSAGVGVVAFYSGDFAIESIGGNFAIDRVTIYRNIPDLADYDEAEVEEVVKLVDWNFDDNTAEIPFKMGDNPNLAKLSYTDDGRVHIQTSMTSRLAVCSDPLGGKDLKNFVWQFDYETTEFAWNNDFFTFHSQGANDFNCLGLRIKGGKFCEGGDNVLIEKKVDNVATILASTRIEGINDGHPFKIRISMQGSQIKVWIWPSDAATPEAPTLQATNDADFLERGKTYIYGYQTFFIIDNVLLYSGNPDRALLDTKGDTEEDETVKLIDWDFDDKNAEIPFNMGNDPTLSTLSYTNDGRLHIQTSMTSRQAVCSDPLGGKDLKNFVWQFDYETTEFAWNNDFFTFHSQGANDFNCLGLRIKGGKFCEGGDNVFIDKKVNNVATTLASTRIEGINDGLSFKIRISMQGDQIKVWVWPSDEATPEEPTLQGVNDEAFLSKGKTYIYGYQTFFYLDDVLLYSGNPDRSLLDTKSLADRQERLLLIDTDFSDEKDVLCKADKEPASVKVKDGMLKVASGAQNMLYATPMLDGVEAYNLSWQFDYIPSATQWNTDRFVFHSDGKNEGHALFLEILGSGPAKKRGTNVNIVRRYSDTKDEVLASANLTIVKDTTYTVRIICKDDMIYLYLWNSGSNTPTEPTLTVRCEDKVVKKGKFILQGYESNYALDNMRLYNYHDGHQIGTYLYPLPSNVRLIDWHFDGMRSKTDFPFVMKDSLKYWQNTLKIKTPKGVAVDSKNLIGDHPLGDLCLEFQIRDFEPWSVNQFVIHSKDGGMANCIYLLYCGERTAGLENPTGQGADPDCSTLRLIQVVDGNATLIGKAKVELKRGKAYNVKITSLNNRVEVSIGAKRTGKIETVISAQASDKVSRGMTFIKGYQSNMWLDNVVLSNSAVRSNVPYNGSLYAVKQ